MRKKLVLGTLLVALIGFLVVGAVIRTVDKTGNVAEACGLGPGRSDVYEDGERQGQDWGRGRGAQEGAEVEPLYRNREGVVTEQMSYQGTVVQAPESGGDLYIKTEDGGELQVGTGPGNMEAQGFTLQEGDAVRVEGHMEGDELKASAITRLQYGQTIALRDEAGRPAWAGSGWRAVEREAAQGQGGQVWGGGGRGQGRGQGGYGAEVPGGAGLGQAAIDELVTVQGTVLSVSDRAMVVESGDGEQIAVENRPWWFAQEQGFTAQPEDQVTVIGFYDGEQFEVSQLENATNGLVVPIRDQNGRPQWAGRGRWGE